MRENRGRKTAILTTIFFVLILSFSIINLPNEAFAQVDSNVLDETDLEESMLEPEILVAEDDVAVEENSEEDETAETEGQELEGQETEGQEIEGEAEVSEISATESLIADMTEYVRQITYPEYLGLHDEIVRPAKEIYIPADSYVNANFDIELLPNYAGLSGNSIKTSERGYVEWEVEVEEAGFYNIEITYYQVLGRSSPIQRSVVINGQSPFSEARFLTLARVWGDDGPVTEDIFGNHLRPRQVEKPMWQSVMFTDPLGYEMEPFLFYFEAGTNTVRLDSIGEEMVVHSLRLGQKDEALSYDDVARGYENLGYQHASDVFVKLQGEDADYRSSPTIIPEHDMSDPTVEPYHPAEIRMNSIGGHRWKNVGEWASWEFEVPENGLYQIVVKAKQDQQRGVYTNRRFLIDGKVPFAEADSVRFPYDNRYNNVWLEANGEPALVYLEKGTHELALEVVLGDVAAILRKTEEAIYNLNTIYRRIIMITSGQPDPLRSYQLESRIPGLVDALLEQANALTQITIEFEQATGQRGSHTAIVNNFVRLLEDMARRVHAIPTLIPDFRDNIGSLGTWMMTTLEQPLQIDYLIVASPEQEIPRATPSIMEIVSHEVRSFASSFVYDYSRIGELSEVSDADNSITVWIGSGRDQAQALKQMIEDTFTPETGISVNLELIQAMDSLLIPAIIAETAPDAALGAANMDLAFRGALMDISEFDDFEEISQRFMKSAFLPFRWRDNIFALPETQGFPMLFYRKDVMQELGLEIPQTWEDVYAIIPELQKENLNFGLQPSISTFQTFLYQQGVALFKEDVIATTLDAEVSVEIFNELTDLFTLHGLLLHYDERNRFRMGEMPLMIANYGLYNELAVFAPELRGEWGMTQIPGTVMEDGTINRAVPVAGTVTAPGAVPVPPGTSGAVILEGSQNKDLAWEFLKWWTSADTQTRFGREMESLMGAAARYATANLEAFTNLPWNAEERDAILKQWQWVEGVPAVLGGYYVNRQFDWLFRAVVLENEPVRESMLEYDRAINEEIVRKREEFDLESSIDQLSDEIKDLYWSHYTHVDKTE